MKFSSLGVKIININNSFIYSAIDKPIRVIVSMCTIVLMTSIKRLLLLLLVNDPFT